MNYTAEVPAGIDRSWLYFWVSVLDHVYWVFGSTAGALFGSFLAVDLTGLDFFMTAMFFVIFLQQWVRDGVCLRLVISDHMPALIGVLGSVLCLAIFGADAFMIPAMVTILAGLLVYRRVRRASEVRTSEKSAELMELCTEREGRK